MTELLRVLLVEDSPTDAKLVLAALRSMKRAIEHERVESPAGMRAALANGTWDLVISDWSMPQFSAVAALGVLHESSVDVPFIIVSGTVGEELAVEAMRSGAHDYLSKERLGRLAPAVERELRFAAVRAAERRSSAALRESEARYRRIVETTNHGIWELDGQGRTTFANARMGALLRCAPESLAGRLPAEFLDPEGEKAFTVALEQQRRGSSVEAEVRFLCADGTSFQAHVDATPILGPAGELAGSVALVTDTTERRRAEAAVRVSDARFRGLWDSGILAVVICDLGGRFTDINVAGARMLGYSRDEFLASVDGWGVLTPPEWVSVDAIGIEQLRATGAAVPWEKELLRRDGTRVPVLVGAAMLDGDQAIAFALDLSERKRADAALANLEAQLRQSQKMEAVGRLAGGVAHDFNNLLSVILGLGEMLVGELKKDDPMRDDIEEIVSAGNRAAALTRQLLLFSRQHVVAPKNLDLNEVLAGLTQMLQRLIGEDVDIVTVAAPGISRVNVDPGSLEQVIMNLVVNARDAMPTGGKLTIETGEVVLDEEYTREHVGMKPGRHVMLAVSDTGIGMDAATRARIFEPFFTTKADKGTGLGLSTVFGIVQQSSGSVWVYSEPGIGTTFKVYLPRAESQTVDESPVRTHPAVRGDETVLLVEDEPQVRAVALGILRRHGYTVLEASNGSEALVICERHEGKINLLLTDVVMPVMSGPDLAKRAAPIRPEMKVLCMSGYTDDSIVRHGVLSSQIAYLQKPFTPATLTAKVRAVLDGPRTLTPPAPEAPEAP